MTGQGRSRTPDPRDPRPCSTCGHLLVHDGWGMVHTDGPQRNYGEMNCAEVARQAAENASDQTLADEVAAGLHDRPHP